MRKAVVATLDLVVRQLPYAFLSNPKSAFGTLLWLSAVARLANVLKADFAAVGCIGNLASAASSSSSSSSMVAASSERGFLERLVQNLGARALA